MRRAISVLLFTAIIISTVLPGFAQKRSLSTRLEMPRSEVFSPGVTGRQLAVVTKSPAGAPETRFHSVEALADGANAVVRWQMEVENQNFGFNVYSVGRKGRTRVNEIIILGGATKLDRLPLYGEEYQFAMPIKAGYESFVVETVPLTGRTVSSETVRARFVRGLSANDGILPKTKFGTGKIETAKPNPDIDVQSEMTQSTLAPDVNMQKWIAAQPGVKIGVRANGIYRVDKAQLQAAGFDTASDPSTWQLFTDGLEQAINVAPNGDYVEFYGKGIDRVESDTRIYYLLAGFSQGRRFGTRPAGPGWSTVSARSYNQTFVKKERTFYLNSVVNGDAENYFGNPVVSTLSTKTFNLSGIDVNAVNCTMSVKFQGFSQTAHQVTITLNGHVLDAAVGQSKFAYSGEYTIPVAFLNEGSNTLTMQSSAANDISFFDQVDIAFFRTFLASQNQLEFYTQNYRSAQLSGFTSANVRLFDTTDDGSPVQVTNLSILPSGGQFGVKIPAYRGRTMIAVEDSAIQSPVSIVANTPSILSTTNHDGQLIIVTYKDWMAQANTWADYRRGQGFSVEVVDVADIYDEFNYGVLSADAIKDFFQYAKNNWQTPPQYALLLGDSTYDPRNYQGFFETLGAFDYVPAKIVTTLFTEAPSDDALADFNNDGLAEIAVGRISARNAQTVTNAFNKVVNFEQPAFQTLNNGTLFVSDVDPFFDFSAMSVRLRDQLPAGTSSTMVSRGDVGAQQSVVNAIDTGKYVVNYAGHGSTGVWAKPSFFGNTNVANCPVGQPCINNVGHESIFLTLTCLNGYFLLPDADSLSEVLLNATNGGAVVVWSSTGETTPDVQEEMGQRFYSQLGTSATMHRMGDFMLDAKSVIPGGPDVRLSFTLLGDPMLKIKQ